MRGAFDGVIEYAQTHQVGAGGLAERYQRPKEVREIAERLKRWAGTPEVCGGCQTLPAVAYRAGLAVCGRCREQLSIRLGLGLGDAGREVRKSVVPDDDVTTGAQLRGLAVVFNSPSVDMGFTEYIRPSAADRTFSEQIDVRYLWSHDSALTLGRLTAGTLRMEKTTRGIAIEVDPPKWGASYVESVKRRDVTGQSFGFMVMPDGDEWRLTDSSITREIFDMRVIEASGVSFPAYPATTLRAAKPDERSVWLREQDTAERIRMAR